MLKMKFLLLISLVFVRLIPDIQGNPIESTEDPLSTTNVELLLEELNENVTTFNVENTTEEDREKSNNEADISGQNISNYEDDNQTALPEIDEKTIKETSKSPIGRSLLAVTDIFEVESSSAIPDENNVITDDIYISCNCVISAHYHVNNDYICNDLPIRFNQTGKSFGKNTEEIKKGECLRICLQFAPKIHLQPDKVNCRSLTHLEDEQEIKDVIEDCEICGFGDSIFAEWPYLMICIMDIIILIGVIIQQIIFYNRKPLKVYQATKVIRILCKNKKKASLNVVDDNNK